MGGKTPETFRQFRYGLALIPRTLSASALHVAELCLSRYYAEYIERGNSASNSAATLGSSVHGALEFFVKNCYIEKKHSPDLKLLLEMFKMSFMTEFGVSEAVGPDYDDGVAMLKEWYKRTDLSATVVLSCEVKENFPVKFPNGQIIPFNYIIDRLDQDGPHSYRVVDYKTQRWALRPDDLGAKIQARIYALAVQIKYPDAEEIWVEFDLLRHVPVGMRFTRDDNKATWKFLKSAVDRIYSYNGEFEGETLNPECRWCIRKVSCKAVQSNLHVGGVFSIDDITVAVDRRAQLKWQADAVAAAIKELDDLIMEEAKQLDQLEFVTGSTQLNVGVSSRRAVDAERVEKIIGADLFRLYGNSSITLKDVDTLLKGNQLTAEQKKELEAIIYRKVGEPTIKVARVNPFGP